MSRSSVPLFWLEVMFSVSISFPFVPPVWSFHVVLTRTSSLLSNIPNRYKDRGVGTQALEEATARVGTRKLKL